MVSVLTDRVIIVMHWGTYMLNINENIHLTKVLTLHDLRY